MGKFLRYSGIAVLVGFVGFVALGIGGLLSETDLHTAAWYGDTAEAKRLIDSGADINETEWFGDTPLHVAAKKGHAATALALIKAGANINAKNKIGATPLHLAAWKAQAGIVPVLVKAGADLHVRNDIGETPLDEAIREHGKDSDIALALQNTAEK